MELRVHLALPANQSINQSVITADLLIWFIFWTVVRGIVGNVFHQDVANSGNQAGQRSLRGLQDLDAEPDRPPQDPPQNQPDTHSRHRVTPTADWTAAAAFWLLIGRDSLCAGHARMNAVGDAHRQRADMVRHHSVRRVHPARVCRASPAAVRPRPRPLRTHTHTSDGARRTSRRPHALSVPAGWRAAAA